MSQLTGRIRYRCAWLGRLVLQVEYVVLEPHEAEDRIRTLWKPTGRAWRDARIEDVTWRAMPRTSGNGRSFANPKT